MRRRQVIIIDAVLPHQLPIGRADDYHLPSTHSTWLNFMANSGVKIEPPKEAGLVLPTKGLAIELGNGHFTTDNVNFRGRPVAKWVPLYGVGGQGGVEGIRRGPVT